MHMRYAKMVLAIALLLAGLAQTSYAGERVYGYGVIAAGVDHYSDGRDHVGVAAVISSIPEEAERLAIEQCQKDGVESCAIQFTWDTGCGYVTWGENYQGNADWGIGVTPGEAVDTCDSRGVVCRQEVYGSCITASGLFP